jgi:hypothetical protein
MEWESRLPLFTHEPLQLVAQSLPDSPVIFNCPLLQPIPQPIQRDCSPQERMENYQEIMRNLLTMPNLDAGFFEPMAQFITVEIPQIWNDAVKEIERARIRTVNLCKQNNQHVAKSLEEIKKTHATTTELIIQKINQSKQEIAALNQKLGNAEEQNFEMRGQMIQQARVIAQLREEIANIDTDSGCLIS